MQISTNPLTAINLILKNRNFTSREHSYCHAACAKMQHFIFSRQQFFSRRDWCSTRACGTTGDIGQYFFSAYNFTTAISEPRCHIVEMYACVLQHSHIWSYRVVQKKLHIAQSLMLRCFTTVCSRIKRFYKNAQKLTDNTKSGQILNIVIKYSLFGSW